MSAASGAPSAEDAADVAGRVLALAMGVDGGKVGADWHRVFVAARVERCAPLAWRRSGTRIRDDAPPAVSAGWRRVAVEADARGRAQLELLRAITGAFREAGIEAVVLKGMALAARLYGDPFVRDTADADLYLAAAARSAAAEILRSLGWRRLDGEAPWEESWLLERDGVARYLDVHSRLLDHNLAHLDEPGVEYHCVSLHGVEMRAHTGKLLPAYLASHAAKHQLPPLLWFVDLAELWAGLSPAERAASRGAARDVRLDGYLAWGLEMADAARAGATGDRNALTALGFGRRGRHDGHPVFRDARLASSLGDAASAVVAWVWPPPLRRQPGRFASRCVARVGRLWTRRTAAKRSYELD